MMFHAMHCVSFYISLILVKMLYFKSQKRNRKCYFRVEWKILFFYLEILAHVRLNYARTFHSINNNLHIFQIILIESSPTQNRNQRNKKTSHGSNVTHCQGRRRNFVTFSFSSFFLIYFRMFSFRFSLTGIFYSTRAVQSVHKFFSLSSNSCSVI